jgi:hypothetical protein
MTRFFIKENHAKRHVAENCVLPFVTGENLFTFLSGITAKHARKLCALLIKSWDAARKCSFGSLNVIFLAFSAKRDCFFCPASLSAIYFKLYRFNLIIWDRIK